MQGKFDRQQDPEQEALTEILNALGMEDHDYIRTGLCDSCGKIFFVDPPGGPMTKVDIQCNYNDCKFRSSKRSN